MIYVSTPLYTHVSQNSFDPTNPASVEAYGRIMYTTLTAAIPGYHQWLLIFIACFAVCVLLCIWRKYEAYGLLDDTGGIAFVFIGALAFMGVVGCWILYGSSLSLLKELNVDPAVAIHAWLN